MQLIHDSCIYFTLLETHWNAFVFILPQPNSHCILISQIWISPVSSHSIGNEQLLHLPYTCRNGWAQAEKAPAVKSRPCCKSLSTDIPPIYIITFLFFSGIILELIWTVTSGRKRCDLHIQKFWQLSSVVLSTMSQVQRWIFFPQAYKILVS